MKTVVKGIFVTLVGLGFGLDGHARSICSQAHLVNPVEMSFFGKIRLFIERRALAQQQYDLWKLDHDFLPYHLEFLNQQRALRLAERNDFVLGMTERFGRHWLRQAKEIQSAIPVSQRSLDEAALAMARQLYLSNHLEYLHSIRLVLERIKREHDLDLEGYQTWMDFQAIKSEIARALGSDARRIAARVMKHGWEQAKVHSRRQEILEQLRDVQSEIDLYEIELADSISK